MKTPSLVLFIFTLFTFSVGNTTEALRATFRYEPAVRGEKIKDSKLDSPADIIKMHSLKLEGFKDSKIIIDILTYLDFLSRDRFSYVNGIKIRYQPQMKGALARQTYGPIDIGPNARDNYAVYVHEIGHVVGNSKSRAGQRIYDEYSSAVPEACHFTKYSRVSHGHGLRNEEFAEVFAAFVLAPELLLDGGPECRRAYDFIQKTLF